MKVCGVLIFFSPRISSWVNYKLNNQMLALDPANDKTLGSLCLPFWLHLLKEMARLYLGLLCITCNVKQSYYGKL